MLLARIWVTVTQYQSSSSGDTIEISSMNSTPPSRASLRSLVRVAPCHILPRSFLVSGMPQAKKPCSVCPPTLSAAQPVGAVMAKGRFARESARQAARSTTLLPVPPQPLSRTFLPCRMSETARCCVASSSSSATCT